MSLIHFVRYESSFIFLLVVIQFSKHCLVITLTFPHWDSWPSYQYYLTLYAFLVFLFFRFIFMPVSYCFNYYSFVIYFEIKKYDASDFFLLSQDCFCNLSICQFCLYFFKKQLLILLILFSWFFGLNLFLL